MSAPIREKILDAITRRVRGEYGIPAPEDERDLPVTIVQDGADTVQTHYGVEHCIMPLAIASAEQAIGETRAKLRAQANNLLAKMIQTVQADDTLGGLADGIDYAGGGIQTEAGKFVFAEAQFRVRYHFVRGNPYQIDETEPPTDEPPTTPED
jgi:hypothetical protein